MLLIDAPCAATEAQLHTVACAGSRLHIQRKDFVNQHNTTLYPSCFMPIKRKPVNFC